MALIKTEDVATVRERADIEDVVGGYVTLKRAGANLKGLCPFHDEKSGSFYVNPGKNLWNCFGCGEGGDVIAFVQKIDHLPFAEAVERLADQFGIELRYEDAKPGDDAARAANRGQRARLLEAHKAAAAFYAEQLMSPEAAIGRKFLADRGFRKDAADMFGIGYAPQGWDTLTKHLTGKGFTHEELVTGGLALKSAKGDRVFDAFRGRLLWPIRDTSGDVVGFGARKLYDDDTGPKFLNTNETPIYKKSKVLFGLDLARKAIAANRQVVVVEGYADVMACHLSGITTAVATCGTAFGEDHVRLVRRLIDDSTGTTGEIIYTFDGDTAGQKAALRAYEMDGHFQTRTFVAVEPDGLDPCDVRLHKGEEAVRDLIESRVPLFRFVITSTLGRHDLDSSEGRVNALADAAPIIARIREDALRPEYESLLARWLALPISTVAAAVARARSGATSTPTAPSSPAQDAPAAAPEADAGPPRPNPSILKMERETLRLLIQQPAQGIKWLNVVSAEDYAHPAYRALFTTILGLLNSGTRPTNDWHATIQAATGFDTLRALTIELAVEPARTRWSDTDKVDEDSLARHAFYKVAEDGTARRITEVSNAVNAPGITGADRIRLTSEIMMLTRRKRDLRTAANTA